MVESVDYKKIIIKTILISLVAVLLALGVFVTIMISAFTKTTANFVYGLGMDRWASQLYYKVYEKDDDLLCGYKALSISIQIGNSDKVIEYYESLAKDKDYSQLIKTIEESNSKLNIGVLEKSSLLNEEDYLKDNYIHALKKIGRVDDAFDIAIKDFQDHQNILINDLGLYSLNIFAKDNSLNRFNIRYDGFDGVLVDELQAYFGDIVSLFNVNKDRSDLVELDRAYLVALADRIMIVGQNINAVYAFNNNNADKVADNKAYMAKVNDVVKGLI